MATLAISYTFSPTTTVASSQVNQNFTDIVNFVNNTASPVGLVAAWKGSVASIPTGWTLDTDLQDRMIIGAGNLYAYQDTGGVTSINLAHTHTGPSHTHTYSGTTSTYTADVPTGGSSGANKGGTHSHTFSGTTASEGTGATSSSLSAAQSILPPYYALAYIRRT